MQDSWDGEERCKLGLRRGKCTLVFIIIEQLAACIIKVSIVCLHINLLATAHTDTYTRRLKHKQIYKINYESIFLLVCSESRAGDSEWLGKPSVEPRIAVPCCMLAPSPANRIVFLQHYAFCGSKAPFLKKQSLASGEHDQNLNWPQKHDDTSWVWCLDRTIYYLHRYEI